MTLKQYIAKALIDFKDMGGRGNVEFNLIVSPELYKDTWELIVIGTMNDKDSKASTIKFTVSI